MGGVAMGLRGPLWEREKRKWGRDSLSCLLAGESLLYRTSRLLRRNLGFIAPGGGGNTWTMRLEVLRDCT